MKAKLLLFILLVTNLNVVRSQTWAYYTSANSGLSHNRVWALGIDKNGIKWCGTEAPAADRSGLSSFNGLTWTVYTSTNSAMPLNQTVWDIKFDKVGNAWFATGGGLVKYDGTNWTLYNTSNSGIISDYVKAITFDASGNVWVGCRLSTGGISKFDGSTWTNYDSSNTAMPENDIFSLGFDAAGYLWAGGASGGIVKMDPSSGTVVNTYNTSNSSIINDQCHSLLIDRDDVKWFGSSEVMTGGLTKFDGTWTQYISELPSRGVRKIVQDSLTENLWLGLSYNLISGKGGVAKFDRNSIWTYYDKTNGLPDNNIRSIAIDYSTGDVWIGTVDFGVAILRGSTTISDEPQKVFFTDLKRWPNPFKKTADIPYIADEKSIIDLCVYDLSGRKVAVIKESNEANAASFTLDWQTNLPSGIYLLRLQTDKDVQMRKIFITE